MFEIKIPRTEFRSFSNLKSIEKYKNQPDNADKLNWSIYTKKSHIIVIKGIEVVQQVSISDRKFFCQSLFLKGRIKTLITVKYRIKRLQGFNCG